MRKKSLNYIIGSVISGIITLVSIPVLTWYFSSKDIAISALFLIALNLLTMLCSLGLEQYILRNYYELNDSERMESFFSIYLIMILSTIFFSFVMYFLWKKISLYLFYEETWLGIILLITTVFSNVLIKISSVVLRMENESLYYSIGQIFLRALCLFVPLIISKLFRVEFNWLWLISLTALSYYIVAIFQQVICWYCGYIMVGISKNVMMISKKALKYSVPLMGSLFIIWSLSSFDKLILQQIVSEYDLGLYVNAFRFASVGLLLQQLVSTIWSPLSIKWYLKNPNPEAFKITLNISVMMSIVIYLISILLLPFLKYTMHEDFYESLDIVPILLTFPLFFLISEFANVGIVFKKRSDYVFLGSLITAFVTFFLYFSLTTKYGVKGAAYAVSFSYFMMLVVRSYFSRKCWVNIISLKSLLGVLFLLFVPFFNIEHWLIGLVFTIALSIAIYDFKHLRFEVK
ncbi:oligosaccharide flippase family protein [Vibrio cholerae]|uniref:lipopolysaccharide biosynthesis protein n=1 Tax=Vibrio cholerae TaxID=666 RepID=UPI0011DAB99E|nr:oligosaccharide flippase family protein [Vibrio cholerae]EGR4342628.1 hypothetical protein [Vibrio cholerae]EII2378229.1 oligosaccharide flippase family protein [Vibrio cholerae]EJL6915744.1 oligosaccharide flippase family protein [Vibrio cholerae]TXX63471.1 oligosaccharide flippase family protein [Vibrio cholerae]BCN17712.1 putative O-antigen flippase [Vibrio cholerae]